MRQASADVPSQTVVVRATDRFEGPRGTSGFAHSAGSPMVRVRRFAVVQLHVAPQCLAIAELSRDGSRFGLSQPILQDAIHDFWLLNG